MKNPAKAVKIFTLIIATIVSLWAMRHAAGGSADAGFFIFPLWVLSPYIVFLGVTEAVERYTAMTAIATVNAIIAGLMLAFTLLAYSGLNGASSTEGLIFVFAPVWLFFGAFLLVGAWGVIYFFQGRRAD